MFDLFTSVANPAGLLQRGAHRTALAPSYVHLAIDLQDKYCDNQETRQAARNAVITARALRSRNIPTLWIYDKGLDKADITTAKGGYIIEPPPQDSLNFVFGKNGYSAMLCKGVRKAIRRFSATDLLISGVNFSTCCYMTARDAVSFKGGPLASLGIGSQDLRVTVLTDSTADNNANQQITASRTADYRSLGVHMRSIGDVWPDLVEAPMPVSQLEAGL